MNIIINSIVNSTLASLIYWVHIKLGPAAALALTFYFIMNTLDVVRKDVLQKIENLR